MKTIVLATNNRGKILEFEALLSSKGLKDFKVLSLKDCGFDREVEENADSFEGNAYKKAKEVADFTGLTAIADDSGLEVDALNGAPGVYSARYAGEGASSEQLMAKLLSELKGVKAQDRSAHFTSVICAVLPSGKVLSQRGECHGVILESPKGTGGFGYDPLFYYPPAGISFAEMETAEKNKVSHRAVAFDKIIAILGDMDDNEFIPVKNSQ